MKIPFLNISLQHKDDMERIHQAIDQVFEGSSFILGPIVEQFESACGKYLGVPHAIGVNSGTDALLMTLKALGVGQGDEVIVPTFTFVAVADVVVRIGARPVATDSHAGRFVSGLHTEIPCGPASHAA